MRYIAMSILFLLPILVIGQKTRILFITNPQAPITYSPLAYNVLRKYEMNRDTADAILHTRIAYCTFLNNDTNHYSITKYSLRGLGGTINNVYPYNDLDKTRNRYTRPDVDVLGELIKQQYDYVITLNKVNITNRFWRPVVSYWFSIYDEGLTEVYSSRHYSRIDISMDIRWHAFIQVFWEPCEDFEERLLMLIDRHETGENPNGSSCEPGDLKHWQKGRVVMRNGDTLTGFLKYCDPYKLHYRLGKESPPELLQSHDIARFSYGEVTYESLFVHQITGTLGKYAFARVVADGNICLYKLGENESARYYIKRSGGEDKVRVRFTPDHKRITNKKAIKSVFGNEGAFISRIDNRKFGAKDLEKLVFLYNGSG